MTVIDCSMNANADKQKARRLAGFLLHLSRVPFLQPFGVFGLVQRVYFGQQCAPRLAR